MATQNKFNSFILELGKGTHHLHAAGDTLKVYLSNTTPSATDDSIKADLAEISTGNGYTGPVDIQNDYTESGGVGTMTAQDVVITASGGTIGPFRYAVIFNDTATNDPLISWVDYGSSITLNDGESVTIDFGSSVITL